MKKTWHVYWMLVLLGAGMMNLAAQDYTITTADGKKVKISQKDAQALQKEIQRSQAEEAAKQERARQMLTNGQEAEAAKAEPVGPVKPGAGAGQGAPGAAVGPTVDNRRKPDNVIQWLENNNWQKFAEIRDGNVIFLRRSTDVPTKPGETVILRWQTPTEFANKAYLSSRPGHLPNRPLGPQLENRIKEGTEFGD